MSIKIKLVREEKGQALVESAIIIPIVLIMIMMIIQFTIIITVQLGTNFTAWRVAKAIYISSNRSKRYGYGNSNSVYKDASITANKIMSIFFQLGWIYPVTDKGVGFAKVELFYYNSGKKNKVGAKINRDQIILPDRDIWVRLTVKSKIVVPLTRYVFADNPFATFTLAGRTRTIYATSLVHTPHRGKY